MKKKIVILTGNEIRHNYFRLSLSSDKRFKVLKTFCEGEEKSLEKNVLGNKSASKIEKFHVAARTQSEKDFFLSSILSLNDDSNPKYIKKGDINNKKIVKDIITLKPDLIICYGSSIIKSTLLNIFKNRFINVHLGLSPYYRGSGTNVWPLINNEPQYVGATFMYIDENIDTGKIIHQLRPNIYLGDSPHTIGNRLITQMVECYADIIYSFSNLSSEKQFSTKIKSKFYYQKDFNSNACSMLYNNFNNGLILNYLNKNKKHRNVKIIKNKGLLKNK